MISSITPEDRETWDKKMKDHSRRLKRSNLKAKMPLLILAAFFIAWIFTITWNACNKPYTPPRTPEQVMEDTLRDVPSKAAAIPDSVMTTTAPRRYFLVSYSTMRKDSHDPILGHMWLWTYGGFFSKKELDAIIYKSLSMRKECYQSIVITSIYEFKNKEDYEAFSIGAQGDPPPKEPKSSCDPLFEMKNLYWTADTLQFESVDSGHVWADTTGWIIKRFPLHDTAKEGRDTL